MTANPRSRIEADLKTAMKARQSEQVQTLRMLLSEVKNHQIDSGEELSEADFVAVVKRAVKQRRDAVEQYRDGNRPELADKEEREIGYLEGYLPAQVDEETMRRDVREHLEREGLSGMQAMGDVMKAMIEHYGGGADGKTLSGIVREELNRDSP